MICFVLIFRFLPPSLPPLPLCVGSVCFQGIVHTACQKAFHQSSMRQHHYCVALRGQRCVRALRQGGSGGSGRLPLVSVLFFSTDPLLHRLPLPFLLQAENRFNCSSMFTLPESAIVQRQEPCWQLCGKPLIVSAHHRKLLMESNVGRKKGLKRTFTCVR